MPRKKKTTGSAKQKSSSNVSGDRDAKDISSAAREPVGNQFARITAPRQLNDPEKRAKWKLPMNEHDRGPYIIELNLQYIGGLPGAASEFLSRFNHVRDGMGASKAPEPIKISKTYYRCDLSVNEWRKLLETDEAMAVEKAGQTGNADVHRTIFRLWPDFPVSAQLHRSIATIKSDAALRSFDAAGAGIVWAVIDSGVQSNHPHFFGDTESGHVLDCKEVRDLHRCFVAIRKNSDDKGVVPRPLADPDADPKMDPNERIRLVDAHRNAALTDENGHGTHVAGIIAGGATNCTVRTFERQYKLHPVTQKVEAQYKVTTIPVADRIRYRGVAPRCKLISLRVLDDAGDGRSSDVIRALEYLREINDDTRLLRVHGANLSVGYEYDPEMFACGQSPLCAAVERLVQAGMVIVAAAGNTGYGILTADVRATRVGLSNTINDPGNAASAITVGSTHPERPYTYGVSYFSSKGPTADGRLKPDLVAPGERIISCAAGEKLQVAMAKSLMASVATASRKEGTNSAQMPGDQSAFADYIEDTGTSMAAPHVSGAVAAFLSIRREFIGKPHEVKRIFLESASPLGRERYFEGRGLLDLMRAIQLV
jgi:subtilisin family serine protease